MLKTSIPQGEMKHPCARSLHPKKAIHYVMWRFNPGGMELSVNNYIRYFREEHELHAYSLKSKENNIFDPSKIGIHLNQGKGIRMYLTYYQYCRKNKDAIFHLLNAGPLVLLLTLLAGVKNPVYHIHGTKYWSKRLDYYYLKPLWWIGSFFKVTFVANSKYSASIFHKEVLPSVQPSVIYNGFEVEKFLANRLLRQSPRKLIYAGRLHTGKNIELIIRLFAEIAEKYPEMELQIAGEGPLWPALEAQAAKSDYGDRIKFLGFVKDIAGFYGSADLFLFLSAYESFGNVVAEALLTGLPVLTSDIPVFKEIHGGEPAFLLGNPDHYEALKTKLLHSLESYPTLAQKAWSISEDIRSRFDIDQHLKEIATIYEKY